MAAKQAEGVAYLCQLLERKGLALLADEVGMGKTFQALGIVKLLQQVKPDAKVLIIAPNRNICEQWIGEVNNFEQYHWKKNLSPTEHRTDLSIAGAEGGSKAKPSPFSKLEELVQQLINDKLENKQNNLYFTTIHALSGLVPKADSSESEKLQLVANKAFKLKEKVLNCLGSDGFDLLIIDEAHYLRTRHGGSQKVEAAKHFFGQHFLGQNFSPVASKVLLMTATPTHSSAKDVENILRYFTTEKALQHSKNKSKDASVLLVEFGLRRLRLLQGRDAYYAKQHYRREIALPVSFEDNPDAELFFGLYQRQLVRGLQKKGSNKQFLYGYLEGFESFGEQDVAEQAQSSELNDHDDNKAAFKKAPDSKLLYDLSQEYHRHFGTYPQHPKYKALVDKFVPNVMSPANLDECKHLVFVRRIPSVRELTKRVNSRYDDLFGKQIAGVLGLGEDQTKNWKSSNWSRVWLNKWSENDEYYKSNDDESEPDEITQVDEDDSASRVSSRITELFVVKKKGTGSAEETRNTICTNVGLRFKKPESIFSLFLEPALDYGNRDYEYYLEQKSGEKTRAIYSSAAQLARNQHLDNASKTMEGKKCEVTIPTIWRYLLEHLEPEHTQILDSWDKKVKENFSNYFKAGVLFASPVMIELFCWFMICNKKDDKSNSSNGSALSRYNDFITYSREQLKDSNLLWYFKAALTTFEDVCNKIARIKIDYQHDWHELKVQSSPAAYASGESSNRSNLQLGFNSPFYPNVLVATSVFQEGVNLHLQCNNIHHYGIAGSPGDHEQRVGRLDRLFSKVNRQFQSGAQGQLNINFPYLESSFDEDQLASFLEKKTLAENKLDKCLLNTLDSSIGTQKVQNWKQYLKQPENQTGMIRDPYPANF